MSHSTFTQTAADLEEVLGLSSLRDIGRSTEFTRRDRIITADKLVPTLLSAIGDSKVNAISDLLRSFNYDHEASVSYKPFYDRLNRDQFPVMMKACFDKCIAVLRQQTLSSLGERPLRQLDDVLI